MNDNQDRPTDQVRVVTVTPAQPRAEPQTVQENDTPPWEDQEQADQTNTMEYWKTLANLNGESCRKLVEALKTESERANDALKEILSLKDQLDAVRSQKIVSVPNNIFDLFANFTGGKIQSITIYFSTADGKDDE